MTAGSVITAVLVLRAQSAAPYGELLPVQVHVSPFEPESFTLTKPECEGDCPPSAISCLGSLDEDHPNLGDRVRHDFNLIDTGRPSQGHRVAHNQASPVSLPECGAGRPVDLMRSSRGFSTGNHLCVEAFEMFGLNPVKPVTPEPEDQVDTHSDFVRAQPVVDGAGVPLAGCSHGVAWYAKHLGAFTAAALAGRPDLSLADGLSRGIEAVANLHVGTCDLDDPNTPCAAIGILRIGAEQVDTLALSDCVVVVETAGDGPPITCDLAIEQYSKPEPVALAGLIFDTPEHREALRHLVDSQTRTRNREDGWWVASNDPEAAYHALTASYPRDLARRMAVYSDGSTRPVDQMSLYEWPAYLDLLDKLGPDGLIAHVRTIESGDPQGKRFPRTKRHDDATVIQYLSTTDH